MFSKNKTDNNSTADKPLKPVPPSIISTDLKITGDLNSALHFNHFERPADEAPIKITGKIKIKDTINLKEEYHLDHWDNAGDNNFTNMVLLTRKENMLKGDLSMEELLEFCKKIIAKHDVSA